MRKNGLLLLTGALFPFDNPAPEMLSYALSKNAVHNLSYNLKNDNKYKNKQIDVITILPSIIDNEANRKAMPQ